MAVLSANGAANVPAGVARVRQRKISVKALLAIYKQRDIVSGENELEPSQVHHLSQSQAALQLRDLHSVETGVDKNEEDEVHLQQVINAAQRALASSKQEEKKKGGKTETTTSVYIPTPDALKIWPEAGKFYNDNDFKEPDSYIKFSATVEDTVGVEYNMDEVDEEFFLNVLSKDAPKLKKSKAPEKDKDGQRKPTDEARCTELEFEVVCDRLEKAIEEKQPFLSVDPTNILSFSELSAHILEEFNSINTSYSYSLPYLKYRSTTALKDYLSKELKHEPFLTLFDKKPFQSATLPEFLVRPVPKLLELFGQQIYNHWKERKIQRNGKHVHYSLKFEDPNANEKDNDSDPYVCFRRREFRQARKTRRADTLGAERIRLLQKSLHRARDLVLSVCRRELIKQQVWESERSIFKLRCDAKTSKRAVGVKGDDYLFYPHKRKKIIKPRIRDEEAERESRKQKEKRLAREAGSANISSSQKDRVVQNMLQQQEVSTSSTQPYVRLPPSRIPDMDLVTVSLVLNEKNETIKRAVLEKLRKRRELDRGFVNLTDDPFQPYFNISTNDRTEGMELNHVPYSSIAASNYHQFNTANYVDETMRKLIEEGKKPLPGTRTFRGLTGELIPSKAFPHLLTLLQDYVNRNTGGMSYIAQLRANVESNNFNAYSSGYGQQYQQELGRHSTSQLVRGSENEPHVSEPVFRLRRRIGRLNRAFVDRRGLVERPKDVLDEFLNFEGEEDKMEVDEPVSAIPNVYDSKADAVKRLDSRWQFDLDLSEYQCGVASPFSLDPSRLNCISDDTQSIRFGSMLLSKSYDLLRESVSQRQSLIQQARTRSLQQQQLAAKQNGSGGSSNSSSTNNSSNQNANSSSNPSGGPGSAAGSAATSSTNLAHCKWNAPSQSSNSGGGGPRQSTAHNVPVPSPQKSTSPLLASQVPLQLLQRTLGTGLSGGTALYANPMGSVAQRAINTK